MVKKVFFLIVILVIATIYQIRSLDRPLPTKFVVVIDPGHGGKDQGASRDHVYEEDINFQVALYVKQLLEAQDVTVIMTRTSDIDLASDRSENRKREDLKKRVELMNEADVFVSIHMNISSDTSVMGSQVFSSTKEESKILAEYIQLELKELNQSKFHSKVGDYYILNQTSSVGVIVECGFLSNIEERRVLQDAKYQEKLAYAICIGILNYRGK